MSQDQEITDRAPARVPAPKLRALSTSTPRITVHRSGSDGRDPSLKDLRRTATTRGSRRSATISQTLLLFISLYSSYFATATIFSAFTTPHP